jgi:outer membrane protein, multidrug efflux system
MELFTNLMINNCAMQYNNTLVEEPIETVVRKGMMIKRLIISSALSALIGVMAGCAVGPDYIEPAQNMPDEYLAETIGGVSAENLDAEWWKSFGDQQLNDLVNEAIENNKDLSQALWRLNEARAVRREGRLGLFPSVQAVANYEATKLSSADRNMPSDADRTFENYEAGFDATWELDFFGRIRRYIEAAEADEDSATASLSDAVRIVVSEVARQYLELRGLQEQLRVAETNTRAQQNTFDLVEVRTNAGASSDLDVARSRAQLESTRALIPSLQADIRAATYSLAILTGKQPQTNGSKLLEAAPLPNYPWPLKVSSPGELLKNRPDIRAAERQLAAETARIGFVEADLYPRVTLLGSLGVSAARGSDIFDGDDYYRFGPSITWAAFDWSRIRARVAAADARAQIALAEYEQTVLKALAEVETAAARVVGEKDRQLHLDTAAMNAARATELARTQFRVGTIDFLTVLDVERVQLRAEADLAISKTELSVALVAFFKALGGGLPAIPTNGEA